jgi:hypothetical protein
MKTSKAGLTFRRDYSFSCLVRKFCPTKIKHGLKGVGQVSNPVLPFYSKYTWLALMYDILTKVGQRFRRKKKRGKEYQPPKKKKSILLTLLLIL